MASSADKVIPCLVYQGEVSIAVATSALRKRARGNGGRHSASAKCRIRGSRKLGLEEVSRTISSVALRILTSRLERIVSVGSSPLRVQEQLTGLFSIFCRIVRPFLIWLLRALESRGLRSSKLQRSSPETDMTAPQLSNSPQYCQEELSVRARILSEQTYVRCGEHRDENTVIEKFVSVFNHHVCPANQVKIMLL